jgi:hypothetical protein
MSKSELKFQGRPPCATSSSLPDAISELKEAWSSWRNLSMHVPGRAHVRLETSGGVVENEVEPDRSSTAAWFSDLSAKVVHMGEFSRVEISIVSVAVPG